MKVGAGPEPTETPRTPGPNPRRGGAGRSCREGSLGTRMRDELGIRPGDPACPRNPAELMATFPSQGEGR